MGLFSWAFGDQVEELKAKAIQQAALQREVQMAVNIAKARDSLQIFGSCWAVLATSVTLAQVTGRNPPKAAFIPVVVGSIVLGNLADMAYGTKLTRVVKEAEHILDHERARFVPPRQIFFSGHYTDEDKAVYAGTGRVGSYWPFGLGGSSEAKPDS